MTGAAPTAEDLSVPASTRGQKVASLIITWWDRVGIFAVLILLVALMALMASNFFTVSNGMNVARSASINAILASGMTLVILTAGIDLSVGSILAIAGVSGVMLHTAGTPMIISVLGGIAVGALAGFINGIFVAWLALPAFIVTLGAMTYLRGASYALLDGMPLIANDLSYSFLGNGYIGGVPTPVIVTIVVYIILWFVLERTRFGRHVYAVGGNPVAARLAGINVRSVLLRVYMIAGATAALGGIIFSARVLSAQPTAGETYELDAIAAVVLGGTSLAGGRGRITGTLVGALILGVLSNGLVLMNVPFFYQQVIKGLVIVFAIALDSLRRFGDKGA